MLILEQGDIVNPHDPNTIFYNDLSPSDATHWSALLGPHSYGSFSTEATVEPWRSIPSAYLICEKDNAIVPEAQRGVIEDVRKIAPHAFDLVESCDASHSPFLSMPDVVAGFLVRVAAG